jgi:hypothetical protein
MGVAMHDATRYFIVQHVANLFRREPRNVGVIVELRGQRYARFYGEVLPGQLDLRTLPEIAYPDVYRQWIDYWRRLLRTSSDLERDLTEANGAHYNVVVGGEVSETGNDPLAVVCDYLYCLLVTELVSQASDESA